MKLISNILIPSPPYTVDISLFTKNYRILKVSWSAYTLFFYKNGEIFSQARLFLTSSFNFSNSVPSPPPEIALNCIPWCKLSFRTVKRIPGRLFFETPKIFRPNLSLDILIEYILTKKKRVGTGTWIIDEYGRWTFDQNEKTLKNSRFPHRSNFLTYRGVTLGV